MEKYKTILLDWQPEYEKEISEVYRLLKDQEKKIFDLSWYEGLGDNPLMEYVEMMIKDNLVFVIYDTEAERVAGVFMLSNLKEYKDVVLCAEVHCIICKKYWGKGSRELCEVMKKDLQERTEIKRLIAKIPQNAYSLIKILKSIGFHHEGTIKKVLVFKDKQGNDKLYDEMYYGLDLED